MENSLIDNLLYPLEKDLIKAGIYYRVFARQKTLASIKKKLDAKSKDYKLNHKKMQDFVGIRIVFYFQEDVNLFYQKLKQNDGFDKKNESNTNEELETLSSLYHDIAKEHEELKNFKSLFPLPDKVFMPQRLNLVMHVPLKLHEQFSNEIPFNLPEEYVDLIDFTYEIQLRTVLSEGWHEVEHDLRYKTQNEPWWADCKKESRQLNGIYASLEASESALSNMISEIAYKNYQHNAWDALIRNHFKLRFIEKKLSQEVVSYLGNNPRIGKDILHVDRNELVQWLWEFPMNFSLSTDFVFFLINRKKMNDENITNIEPAPIKMLFDKMEELQI